eukprot:403347001
MQSKLKAQNLLKVQTCIDVLRSIFAYLENWDLLRLQRLSSYMMRVIIQSFTKLRKTYSLTWVINLNADSLNLNYFKKSKILSIVTHYKINIPDLVCLMVLPDILSVIQEKLLEDRRLLVEFNYRPQVILKNNLGRIFVEDEFDQFELANKFNQLSSKCQDLQLFRISNWMDIQREDSSRILFNFLLAFENNLLDSSILFTYDKKIEISDMNQTIIDLAIEKSRSLKINYWAYELVASTRKSVNSTVKNLEIYYQYNPARMKIRQIQLVKQFSQLEILDVSEISMEESDFFVGYVEYFKSDFSKNLKCFKAKFVMCYVEDCRSRMQTLFNGIIGIEVPTMILEFANYCKAGLMDQQLDPAFYDIFDNYKVTRNYKKLTYGRPLQYDKDCIFNLTFKKNVVSQTNQYKYTFDFNIGG